MCGIAGWYNVAGQNRDLAQLDAMANAIAHRGPDDQGRFVDQSAGIALAHLRLSIIDLSAAGHQPMATQDGSVVLIFNGELYNYLALKRELETLGHVFRSRSDTEVVLIALAQWGAQALERFNGMFALAAWHPRERMLLLARDPMGMKPLYYTSRGMGGGLAFASEIKAFLPLEGFVAAANPRSIAQFLEFGYTFDPAETALLEVRKLPPGHSMRIVDGQCHKPIPFFTPPVPDLTKPDTSKPGDDELFGVLSGVVREHLVADVPVGLLLSGGLDSSIVAALAAREAPITTITMAFGDSGIDERQFGRLVANHVGSKHFEIVIQPQDVIEHMEQVVWYFDDIFGDWGTVSTRLLYKRCHDIGIKVVLVGEGADELFGGYSIFEFAQSARGPELWKLFQIYRRYADRRYGGQFAAFSRIMKGYLARTNGDFFSAVRLFECHNQLSNQYVMKVDKASMSVGVEARTPYLDRRIAEIAFRLGADKLISNGTNKYALRAMAERHGLLPEAITRRAKFGASMAVSWMDSSPEFRRYAANIILAPDGWTDRLHLRRAMTAFFENGRQSYPFPFALSNLRILAWRLLLLTLWSRRYLSV